MPIKKLHFFTISGQIRGKTMIVGEYAGFLAFFPVYFGGYLETGCGVLFCSWIEKVIIPFKLRNK